MRVTVVLDEDVNKAIRFDQADQIKQSTKNVLPNDKKRKKSISFSKVLNDKLRKAYKLPPKD